MIPSNRGYPDIHGLLNVDVHIPVDPIEAEARKGEAGGKGEGAETSIALHLTASFCQLLMKDG